MLIGVNARGLMKPFTGIGQYTYNLIKNAAELSTEHTFLLVTPDEIPSPQKEELAKFPNIKTFVVPEKGFTAGIKKTFWERILVVNFFREQNVDIAFYPYPSFFKKFKKTIVTVHDCIPWIFPEYKRGIFSKIYHFFTKRALKYADQILTVSNFSKEEIIRVCDVLPEKIKVIYNDAGDVFKDEEPLNKPVTNNYFLYCGGYDKRKNVRKLVEDFLKIDTKYSLVLAGEKLFENDLYEDLGNYPKDKIKQTGFLSEKDLAGLYRNCTTFINLSTYEGFNIPLLEAANSAVPIILSDIKVHREIAGENVFFVDLTDEKGLEKAISEVLKNKELYVSKAKGLAKKYSWKTSAQEFLNVLSS